jgi:hypothetical protein
MKTRTFYCEESENGVSISVVQLIKIKFYGSGEKRERQASATAPNGDSLRSGVFFAAWFQVGRRPSDVSPIDIRTHLFTSDRAMRFPVNIDR